MDTLVFDWCGSYLVDGVVISTEDLTFGELCDQMLLPVAKSLRSNLCPELGEWESLGGGQCAYFM